MATKTKQEFITRALEILFVLQAGQAPSAEDADTVSNAVRPLLDRLDKDGTISVANEDMIDTSVFEPLANLMANEVAETFGAPFDQARQDRAIYQLKRVTVGRPTYETLSVDVY